MNEAKTIREPLFHITRRGTPLAWWKNWLIRVAAFFCALLLIGIGVLLLFKINPIALYSAMFEGAFVGSNYLIPTLKTAVKLLCLAAALAPAFKMRFWNIGAEGQMLIGGVVAAYFMHDFPQLPNGLLLLFMAVGAMAAGALWGALPAVFKAKFGTNETLFTLMMNYVAINIVNYFVSIWKGDKVFIGVLNSNFRDAQTYEKGYLRRIWQGHGGAWYANEDLWYIVIIGIVAVLVYFYLKKTKQGYEIAVVGDSQNTARYAGISVGKVVIRTMLLSGLICGLCGFLTVSSQTHTISTSITGGYGFTAIIVAWMSKFNTLTMAGISILIVALENGSKHVFDAFYSTTGFPESASAIIVGVFMLFIVGSEFFINYQLNFRRSGKEAK